jgi:hypothetical protein
LDAILRAEMARFQPDMPRLICNQNPLNNDERAQGLRILREHYTDDPSAYMIDAPQQGLKVLDPTATAWTNFVKRLIGRYKGLWLQISGAGTRRKPPGKRD